MLKHWAIIICPSGTMAWRETEDFRKALGLAARKVGRARMLDAPARPPINTVASARCKKAPGVLQPFQRFGWECGKPLSRLGRLAASVHRAEAAVSMRDWRLACEVSSLRAYHA